MQDGLSKNLRLPDKGALCPFKLFGSGLQEIRLPKGSENSAFVYRFVNCNEISVINQRFPNDNMDALTIANSGEDAEEERLIHEIETIINMCDNDLKASVLNNIFMAENYQRLLKRRDEITRRILGDAV